MLRLRAADRRARVRGEDGPVRSSGSRTSSTTDQNRWRDVLVGVGASSRTGSRGWRPRTCRPANVVTGRGIALGSFARLAGRRRRRHRGEQEDRQDRRSKHLYAAQDAGLTVNPAAVENQMIGQPDPGRRAARCYEEVAFNKDRVTSLDWVTYPILRFKDSPKVTTRRRAAAPTCRRPASGEPPTAPVAGGDRERVLRRHGRAHPRGADDAGPRPRRR